MTKLPRELLEFLHSYPPAVQSLAIGLRRVVLEELGGCHEYIFTMRSKVVLVYSSTEHVIKDGICIISVLSRHVTLSFTHGVDLDDEAGVLRGAGKRMRHIRLLRLSDLDRPELRKLLRQARKRSGLGRRPRTADEPVTRVKPRALRAWLG
jgi:uncharacterized protein DUF1801